MITYDQYYPRNATQSSPLTATIATAMETDAQSILMQHKRHEGYL